MDVRKVLTVTAVLVAALAGCSGDDDPAPAPSTAAATAGTDDAPRTTASPTALASLAGVAPGRIVTDDQGHKVTVTPVTMRREGKLALLEIAARNDDPSESVNLALVLRGSGTTFDEVTLVDPAGGKRYLVARDSQDRCLCTSFSGGLSVPPGGTGILSAYFAAPPPAVASVNVQLPQSAGVITGVPVSG